MRNLPRSFEREDLEQVGRLALLEAAPRIEAFARKRVEGAMRDSARFQRYRETQHASLSGLKKQPSVLIDSRTPLEILIDDEKQAGLQAHICSLPADQARVISERMSGRKRQKGRPSRAEAAARAADIAIEGEAVGALRVLLARAA
jgi:hypothetical protein